MVVGVVDSNVGHVSRYCSIRQGCRTASCLHNKGQRWGQCAGQTMGWSSHVGVVLLGVSKPFVGRHPTRRK